MAKESGITAKKDKEFSDWYPQAVLKGEFADYSPVKGCMVIRPNGYSIWEKIQEYFNGRLKELNVRNAYFPLFIPESFFRKEAEHAKGFSPEVAWISNTEGSDERLAVRPTSETIMYDMYGKWVRSFRDLPLRINQWANVVRWETKATRLFLRTREFLWQEGHCVYATREDADRETILMIDEYRKMCEELLAIPVIAGVKADWDKFAGAKYTATIEGLMPDGKALQMGTSHNLGQGFAESFGIRFIGPDEKSHLAWNTSWGFSTRLIGAIVMVHGDDKGVVIPPKLAFHKAVIVPILYEDTREAVLKSARKIHIELKSLNPILDDREGYSPGWKFNEWELKGVPLRIEIGPKDIEKKQTTVVRRDTGKKISIPIKSLKKEVSKMLDAMQKEMLAKAEKYLKSNIVKAETLKEIISAAREKKMVYCRFCNRESCEESLKEKTGGYTSRCTPFENKKISGSCAICGNEARIWMYFAKSY